jgi:hypothetical protein
VAALVAQASVVGPEVEEMAEVRALSAGVELVQTVGPEVGALAGREESLVQRERG